ncbi:MAG: non-ribosomal peptide synthetase, partial [Moorea sp. SIO2I5]|nr:non-ribosomal peptide synthetase [Moorena sp. SIO2I5]
MSTLVSFTTSYIQQANWFLYKFKPTGLSDKLSIAVRIKSPVDIKTLETTLQALTERHAILRSIYYEEDGQIIQKIRENAEIYLAKIDALSWSDEELKGQLSQRAKLPFNLENGSIFRACLFSRSATEYILLLTVHQIAADWESLLILVDDLVGIYESKINCATPDLLPINKSYRDYIHQELDFINSAEGKQIGNYWQENLADELPVLDLPTTSTRPSMRTYNGAAIKFTIKPQLTQQLKQLAKTQGVTIEEIILAVFKVLLYRYTGEPDLLVGLLQKRANQPLFEQVVGNFNNVTVARQAISSNIKFTNLLNQVSKKLFELGSYKNYPFSLLIQDLKSYNLSHPPICQVAFGYSKLEKLFNAKELDLDYYDLPQHKVDFELSLEVTDLQKYSLG